MQIKRKYLPVKPATLDFEVWVSMQGVPFVESAAVTNCVAAFYFMREALSYIEELQRQGFHKPVFLRICDVSPARVEAFGRLSRADGTVEIKTP